MSLLYRTLSSYPLTKESKPKGVKACEEVQNSVINKADYFLSLQKINRLNRK